MLRFALRHWTALLIIVVIAGWAIFYLPDTPAYAVFQIKQAIDARNGEAAAQYVDFQKVVRNAGYEMVNQRNSGSGGGTPNVLGELVGKGAVDLLSGPMAAVLKSWGTDRVNSGDRRVQMPAAAVAAAVVMIHRNGDKANTQWRDPDGHEWEIQMEREDGNWRVVEVKDIQELLNRLKRREEKEFSPPSEPAPVPSP
jgi:Protein of unknown function (DUF2939)